MDFSLNWVMSMTSHEITITCTYAYTCTPSYLIQSLAVSAEGHNSTRVSCRSTVSCDGDEVGMMSARECCVETPSGLAYTVPGQENCMVCTGGYIYNARVSM